MVNRGQQMLQAISEYAMMLQREQHFPDRPVANDPFILSPIDAVTQKNGPVGNSWLDGAYLGLKKQHDDYVDPTYGMDMLDISPGVHLPDPLEVQDEKANNIVNDYLDRLSEHRKGE